MANNYLDFSEIIDQLTDKEKEWFKQELGVPEFIDDWPDEEFEAWCEDRNIEDPCEWPGFAWEFYETRLWVYATESGNIEALTSIVQKFLAKFRPDSYFTVTWSYTCSRPRVGEFGGGAAFVTRDEITMMDSYDWVSDKEQEFKDKNG